MDPLTIAAASGLRARMQSLDLLANNLANSATSGYKNDREFYGLYSSSDAGDPVSGQGASTLPVVERQWTDFSPGTLYPTGNPLDIAIPGNGFFTVAGPHGPLYTRNGSLQISAAKQLVNADGYAIRGTDGRPIEVHPEKQVEIGSDGSVTQDGQVVGRIEVVDFKAPSSLTKVHGSYFQNSDARNASSPVVNPGVQQGKLESSNVPVAEAAMRLVGTMRQFEMLQKAIGISAEMNRKTMEEVARV